MTPEKLTAAITEAERFLGRAQALQLRRRDDPWFSLGIGCKESGALRRASLDLTRALSDLRKS